MRVLVINGSPRSEHSNTFKLTTAFIEGLQSEESCEIFVFNVYQATNLHDCTGCFNCWTKTPGKCIFADDMPLAEYLNSDLIIWSFPLYYFSMPSRAKLVMDRLLPLLLPNIQTNEDGQCFHPSRYAIQDKSIVLISTCGFYQLEGNYDSLLAQFKRLYKDNFTPIFCAQGELFSIPELQDRADEYLDYIRTAGREYRKHKAFSPQTQTSLAETLFSPEVFLEMANAYWDIAGDTEGASKAQRLLTQMAAIYNKSYYMEDITLEICFSDTEEVFQLEISRDKCCLKTNDFQPYTTRIETTLQTWQDISQTKLDGAQAMMDGLYSVSGRFETMQELTGLFSTRHRDVATLKSGKKTNMLVFLLPFILFWIVSPFNLFAGSICTLTACGFTLFLRLRFKFCLYDYLGILMAAGIGVLGLTGATARLLLSGSYIIFAMLWGLSCLRQMPLTAFYSINDYPDYMLHNPLFIKTNRILTFCWFLAYLCGGGVIYALYGSDLNWFIGIFTTVLFGIMGLLTQWFKGFYPAYVARKKVIKE